MAAAQPLKNGPSLGPTNECLDRKNAKSISFVQNTVYTDCTSTVLNFKIKKLNFSFLNEKQDFLHFFKIEATGTNTVTSQ
jgi:hypothetical protein